MSVFLKRDKIIKETQKGCDLSKSACVCACVRVRQAESECVSCSDSAALWRPDSEALMTDEGFLCGGSEAAPLN